MTRSCCRPQPDSRNYWTSLDRVPTNPPWSSNYLLSDRGSNFLSELILEVCHLIGTKKINTSGYHAQTDELVERFNRTLIAMLSKWVDKKGQDWDQQLPYVLWAYRVSPHNSTGESPFFLLHGYDPRLPTELALEAQVLLIKWTRKTICQN